ncbi:MAG: LacI family DNA-binding transcriptional regulator [Oscillospiraceae bacterium]|nr:LacI family DNA-binding transcriptional regulator [Oscillospiraceae bacterium]MDY6208861.1 LacI family DNA-binding transcriptional regulator [Oscillospiraceae bacterium]
MSVTIKDVAKAAGVSVATVSRVLNNSAAVSEETAAAVNEVIKEMGYSPNFLGRNLRKCETNNILAILPSTSHTVYSDIIRGMQDAAYPNYDILLSTSNSYLGTEMRLLEMLFNRTVDAAVLLGTQLDAKTLNDLNKRYNIALCCERVSGAKVLTVTINDEEAAYDAVKMFLKKGKTKIGLVTTGGHTDALSSVDREKGYIRALSEYGIQVEEKYIYRCSYEYSDGCEAMKYFLSLDEMPQAVFCISDLLAAGVIKQAFREGIAVGTELEVCGFDNISLSEMYTPGITTVAQPGYEMGRTVINKLLDNMHSTVKNNDMIVLNHKLVIRGSAK